MSGEYDFCFEDANSLLSQAPVDEDLNKFHKGFIETNYLYINRLLTKDKDNVAKAKKFIINLAIKYYEEKDKNDPKIEILKNQIKFIDATGPEQAPVVSATLVVEPGVSTVVATETVATGQGELIATELGEPVAQLASGPGGPADAAVVPVVPVADASGPVVAAPPVPSVQSVSVPSVSQESTNTYSNIIANIKNKNENPNTKFYNNKQQKYPYFLFNNDTKQITNFIPNNYREFQIIVNELTFDNELKEIKYNNIAIFKEIHLSNDDIVYLCLYDKSILDVHALFIRMNLLNQENLELLTSYDKNKFIKDKPDYIKNDILYNENYIIYNHDYKLYLKLNIPSKNIYISSDFTWLLIDNNFYYYNNHAKKFYNNKFTNQYSYDKLIDLAKNDNINTSTKFKSNTVHELTANNYLHDSYGYTNRLIINTSNFDNFYKNNSNFINIDSSAKCEEYIKITDINNDIITFSYNEQTTQTINEKTFKKVAKISYKNETLLFNNNTFYYCEDLKLFLIIVKYDASNYNLICIKEISCKENQFYLNLSYKQIIYDSNVFFNFIKAYHDFTNDNDKDLTTVNVITDKENKLIKKDNIDIINNKLKYDSNTFIIVNRKTLYSGVTTTDIFYKINIFEPSIKKFTEGNLSDNDNLYCNYNFRQIYDKTNKLSFNLNSSTDNFQNQRLTYIIRPPNIEKRNISFSFNFIDNIQSEDKSMQIIEELNIILLDDSEIARNINGNECKFKQIAYYFNNDNYKHIYNMFITTDNNYIVIINNKTNGILYKKEKNYNKNILYHNDKNDLFTINNLYKIAEDFDNIKEEPKIEEKYKIYVTKFKEIYTAGVNIVFNDDLKKDDMLIFKDEDEDIQKYYTFNDITVICEIKESINESKYHYMFKVNGLRTSNPSILDENIYRISYISYNNEIVISYVIDKYIIYKKKTTDTYNTIPYKELYYIDNSKNISRVSSQESYPLYYMEVMNTNSNRYYKITTDNIKTDDIKTIFGGSVDNDNDINKLLIIIMKNIMFATQINLNKLKKDYDKK